MATIDQGRIALDPLLHSYITGSDDEAGEQLETLLREIALPVIKGVIAARLPREREDAEDVSNEIVVQVLKILLKFFARIIMSRAGREAMKSNIDYITGDRQVHRHRKGANGNMRGLVPPQNCKHILRKPRLVAELDRMPVFFG